MKLAYVVRQMGSAGGRERVLANKANYLVSCGYQVFIITMFQDEERQQFKLDDRIHVRHLKLVGPEQFSGGRYKYFRYVKSALESVLGELSPDIAVSMWWGVEFRVLPFLKDGSQKLLEFHFSQHMRESTSGKHRMSLLGVVKRAITRWIDDRIAERYDRFVVLTHEDRRNWRVRNVAVIPNALSFVSGSQSECSSNIVIAVGRLTEEKGFDRLIHIWADVVKERPDWSLRIFGDGPEKEKLCKLIQTMGLKNIELRPATADVETEMLNASILVSTSRYEGFGMVITEAMQCGLPVIAYRVKCGPAEIIRDNISGFLIDDGDVSSFVERLRQLMADRSLRVRMGKTGKQISYENFNEQVVMTKWKALFEEMMTNG